MKPSKIQIISALFFTVAVPALGYILLGLMPMFLFAFGYVGGFVLWLSVPRNARFASIKVPYFLALVFFVLHITEERLFGFFPALSRITGTPLPEPGSFFAIILWAFTGAWLLIPFLVGRQSQFGHYLAWTFFTTMGVTELAHFVFPFFTPERYGYFPGMATVVPLAPIAWWGMWRMVRRADQIDQRPNPAEQHM